ILSGNSLPRDREGKGIPRKATLHLTSAVLPLQSLPGDFPFPLLLFVLVVSRWTHFHFFNCVFYCPLPSTFLPPLVFCIYIAWCSS
ncbi:hypothetical protein M752DRAFT_248745, partial [Aspergillus phoenicis ATCC 13157]